MASIVVTGVMVVVVIWGQVIGWGWTKLPALPGSSELPALVIAHRVWGAVWWFALFAMFTSVVAASLATQNVATRMWYGMARSGALPKVVAHVNPKRKTPTVAVGMQFVLSMALALIGGRFLGPEKLFILLVGFCLVLAVIFVYSMGNIGVLVPLLAAPSQRVQLDTALRLPSGHDRRPDLLAGQVVQPVPGVPNNWSPLIVGVWMADRRGHPRGPQAARQRGLAREGRRDHRRQDHDGR